MSPVDEIFTECRAQGRAALLALAKAPTQTADVGYSDACLARVGIF